MARDRGIGTLGLTPSARQRWPQNLDPFLSRAGAALAASLFPASQVVGALDLPASRGCCAAATKLATAALQQRQGLQRRRHVSPRLEPRIRREVTVFIEASEGPLVPGHCRRATVFAWSRASPFWEWQCRDLITCLLRTHGPAGGAAGTGVGGLHAFLQELSLAAQPGGQRQLGGGLLGVGLRCTACHISRTPWIDKSRWVG